MVVDAARDGEIECNGLMWLSATKLADVAPNCAGARRGRYLRCVREPHAAAARVRLSATMSDVCHGMACWHCGKARASFAARARVPSPDSCLFGGGDLL